MAKGVRTSVANLVATIEATTPDTRWHGNKRFAHVPTVGSLESLRTAADFNRRFIVKIAGGRSLDGDMLQAREPGLVEHTFDVHMLYVQGDNPHDLAVLVAEDVDRLSYALMLETSFDPDVTGIWRRRVDGYDFDEGSGTQGDVATLVVPVVTTYRPAFEPVA